MFQRPLIALEAAGITVGPRALLEPVTMQISNGDVWLIRGPAGSGKSLLLEVLFGRHRLSQGKRAYPAYVERSPDARLGVPPRFAIRLVSQEEQRRVAIEQASFHQARWHHQWTLPITIDDYLSKPNVMGLKPYEHFEGLPVRRDFDAERERSLDAMQLSAHRDQAVGQLSNGELRKLLLVAAHLAGPDVLLLDDPLGGLDPKARDLTRSMIQHWASTGQTLLISSTHPEDFSDLATHQLTLRSEARIQHALQRQPSPRVDADQLSKPPIQSSAPIIHCRGARVVMQSKVLLDGIDWQVFSDEHWLVTGPNGAGKSTLLALITGDHPQAYSNDIEVLGGRLGKSVNLWQRRQCLGFVSPELGWHYPIGWTLMEVVLSGFESSIGQYRMTTASERTAAARWLTNVGLFERANDPLAAISESERRLVLLARAMVAQPRLLLLDEPAQGLSSDEREALFCQLDQLVSTRATTLVMVSHHAAQRPSCINRCLDLELGRVAGTRYL